MIIFRGGKQQKRLRNFVTGLGVFSIVFGGPICQSAVSSPRSDAMLALKDEQIELFQAARARSPFYSREIDRWLGITRAMKQQIETKGVEAFYSPLNPSLIETAYLSPIDNSPQPYWIALPDNYTSARKWPMTVFLHGYATGISKITPWIPPEEMIAEAKKRGIILAIPYGRKNSDFVQWGQDDVMAVKREVEQLYSVDEKRVTLMGASMGGYGVYAAGLHNIGQFAGLAPISARSDMFYWFKTTAEAQPIWKRLLYQADDPRTLAPNAASTPIFTQHGALDLVVPVEQSRRFAFDARGLDLPFRYLEDPKGDHWGTFQLTAFTKAFDWVKNQQYEAPRKIALVSGDLRESKAHYARITAFENYDQLARLDVEVQGKEISVRTKNVAGFSLDIPKGFFKAGVTVPLEVDGTEARLVDPALPVEWNKANGKLGKTPKHTGPFKNLMRDPFLLVYGSLADQLASAKFADEWKESADGLPKIKSVEEVTIGDKNNFNLILFGTRESNPLIEEIADKLPVELTTKGYRIGTRQVVGEDLGLRMVWESPWRPERLIGICSGEWWGDMMPPNHKWDLIPDYIVYSGKNYEKDDTNKSVEAGFFDGNWGLVDRG